MFCNTNTLLCVCVCVSNHCGLPQIVSFLLCALHSSQKNKQTKKNQRCRVQNHVIIRLRKKYIYPISPHVSNDRWWWCNQTQTRPKSGCAEIMSGRGQQRCVTWWEIRGAEAKLAPAPEQIAILTPTRPTFLFCHTDLFNDLHRIFKTCGTKKKALNVT